MTTDQTTGESVIDWELVGMAAGAVGDLEGLVATDPEIMAGSEGVLQQLIGTYIERGYSTEEAERLSHAFVCGAVLMNNVVETKMCTDFMLG